MNQCMLEKKSGSNSKFYQLIHISNSVYRDISEMLLNNEIAILNISSKSELYVVEAPNKLAILLRKFKNYELFGFSNDTFISLIDFFVKSGWLINKVEFLGENYFEEDLSQEIQELLSSNDYYGLIKMIKGSNLKINKFQIKNGSNFMFYRSGMIYSNDNLKNIVDLFTSFFEEN